MSAPVTDDDLVQGAVKWLLAQPGLHTWLGRYPDAVTPWLFQHTLWVTVAGSQSAAVVLARAGGWAGPNEHNTLRFTRLGMDIWVDPRRDAGGNIIEPGETHRRAQVIFDAFDRVLHRSAAHTQTWGTVRTIGCLRLGEPNVYSVPDGDGLLRMQTFYGVIEG